MPFKSLFVGVSRHKHPAVRDLPGPKRDALAMKSLFEDSIELGEFTLMVDADATTLAISHALDQLFGDATGDDTLLFHFSGHGSENHDLIPHDIDDSRILETTIPMSRIVELMKTSKARNVLCFLDCCFSGGVGAKVLTGLPRTRDSGFSFDSLAGAGRLIVAASEPTGEALECPARNFGLLTLAIMETLREATSPMPVGRFCDELQKRVRAEAGRYGFPQEAVILNQIAGGLQIPNLVPGANYAKHFPDVASIQFDAAYGGMSEAGISDEILIVWRTDIPALNVLQLQSLNEMRLFETNSLVVQSPTSSGKTFIGELASVYHACRGGRSLFLFPYKALATEKTERFKRMYGSAGLRVIKCTGDSRDQVPAFLKGKYDIALMTYEMALSLLASNLNSIRTISCMVIDEAHFISDANRGISVELLMTLIRQSQAAVSAPQLICLSAVSGTDSRLHHWLNAKLQRSTTRPVDLTEGVLARDGSYLQLASDGKREMVSLLKSTEIRQLRQTPSSRDVLIPLVKQHVKNGKSILIFRAARSAVKHTALYLAEALAGPDCSKILDGQNQGDPSNDSNDLVRCLRAGTAFHNSNLAAGERLAVEKAFADPTYPLQVLVSTTTLAAGVNTPADTVVIVETEFPGPTKTPFSVAEYKNMSGRAGRLGYVSAGRAILLAEHAVQQKALFDRYVDGSLPTLTSSLTQDEMETWVLRLMLQVGTIQRDEVVDLLGDTFGGYLRCIEVPGSLDDLRDEVDDAVSELLDNGMLDSERRKLFLTPLGRVCANSLLSYTSSQRIVKCLSKIGRKCSLTELIAIVQCVELCDNSYTPYHRNGHAETRWMSDARTAFGSDVFNALGNGAAAEFALQKRCKRACLLLDWMDGCQIREIEQKFTTNGYAAMAAGDIRRIAENTRLVFKPVIDIAALLLAQDYDTAELETFLRRLEFGVPERSVDLTNMPDAFNRGDLLTLIVDGVHSMADLLSGTYRRLIKHENEAKQAAFAQIKSQSDQ